MISEEKMVHIVHLMLDAIYKNDLVDFPNEDETVRETKRVCLAYVGELNKLGEVVRKRILNQRNPPLENSRQWDILYQKYYEEETKKHGG